MPIARPLLPALLLGLPLALAACIPATNPAPPPMENACGASGLQGLVGQSSAVLPAMNLPAGTRVISPGMAVTMDFRAERLNVEVNAAGIIIRVYCG